MDLEQILSSSCRRKILRLLHRVGSTNVMNLVLKVNSTYREANKHLKILREEQIVLEKRLGHMRLVSLNCDNPRTLVLLEALKVLDTDRLPQSGIPIAFQNKSSGLRRVI